MSNRIATFTFLAAVALPFPSLSAQENGAILLSPWADLKWRSDYNAARKEAHEKNLPIVIDFGTPSCLWCRKLDETTFRDARVVALMNERFVPLKIDGDREVHLTNQLRIESYPTIVLASADGKILSYLRGFQDAETLHEILQRTMANLQSPEWMQRELQLAVQKMQKGEYVVAISALRAIIDDPKGRPLQPHARKLLDAIEKKALERLDQARDMQDRGHGSEAINYLVDTVRYFPGLEASRQASDLIAKMKEQTTSEKSAVFRSQRAKDLLTQARGYYKQRDLVPCLERCSLLLRDFTDLPEGQDALLLMGELKSNPVLLQQAADSLSERLGEMYIALAETHMKNGHTQRAEYFLQRAILACPGSRHAESAQVRLVQLQGIRPSGAASSAKPQ
jgi:thioredoxin-like negative regulator of GroEL